MAEALPVLESSLGADASPRNRMCVAEAFWLSGRPADAVRLLEPWVAGESEAIAPRVLLAWCYEDLHEAESAAGVWGVLRALDPANPFLAEEEAAGPAAPEAQPDADRPVAPEAKEARGATSATEAPEPPDLESQAEPERRLTREELAEVPPDPLYSATLAEIFAKQGFEEKAIQILEAVIRQHPERTDLRDRVAELTNRLSGGSPS